MACPYCPKIYQSSKNLRKHILQKHHRLNLEGGEVDLSEGREVGLSERREFYLSEGRDIDSAKVLSG